MIDGKTSAASLRPVKSQTRSLSVRIIVAIFSLSACVCSWIEEKYLSLWFAIVKLWGEGRGKFLRMIAIDRDTILLRFFFDESSNLIVIREIYVREMNVIELWNEDKCNLNRNVKSFHFLLIPFFIHIHLKVVMFDVDRSSITIQSPRVK